MLKVLSFRVSGKLLGIEVNYVKEITRNPEYNDVPMAPDKVAGLFNMRGQVVTLFNLSYILGYGEKNSDEINCIVLKNIKSTNNLLGFLIEETQDVFDIDEADCEPIPANSSLTEQKYVKKVARLKDEILMLIYPDLIIES